MYYNGDDEQLEQPKETLRGKAVRGANTAFDTINKVDNAIENAEHVAESLNNAREKYKAHRNNKEDRATKKENRKQQKQQKKENREQQKQQKKEDRNHRKAENNGKPLKDRLSNFGNKAKEGTSNLKNKAHDKLGESLDSARKKANNAAMKSTLKLGNAVAPGAGDLANKIYDSKFGKNIKKKVTDAPEPVSAVKAGWKEIKKQLEKIKQLKTKMIALSVVVGISLIAIIVVLIISSFKHGDSQIYFKGTSYGTDVGDVSKLDPKYQEFYKNVEKYSNKYNADRAMLVSVLTAYADNDMYSDMTAESDSIDVETGTDTISDDSNISNYSKSKMKKYIKKVAKKLDDVNNYVDEGDYEDRNTGSEFFWWLIDEFVDDYYEEYLDENNNLIDKKNEIVKYIYLYYNDIKRYDNSSSTVAVTCLNGITVTGENAGTYDLDEYVAGVVAAENAYSNNGVIEAMKAQAVAARTYALKVTSNCTKSIENSTNQQVFKPSGVTDLVKKAVEETSGEVLTSGGDLVEALYDHFKKDKCDDDYCYGTYTMVPSISTHEVKIPKSYLTKFGDLGGHGSGMSQVAANYLQDEGSDYVSILQYFYDDVKISVMGAGINGGIQLGSKGIYSTSIFPIADLNSVEVTQGYLYWDGTAHGAVDIVCSARKREPCIRIPIYASHSGTVESVTNQYCASSQYSNNDTTLKVTSNCLGKGVWIRITDSSDQYHGYRFGYWHFESFATNIKAGDKIEAGDLLGYMGSTGKSTTWHLHFQIQNAQGQNLNQNKNIGDFGKNNGLQVNLLFPSFTGPQY